jgi:hypothetical protein
LSIEVVWDNDERTIIHYYFSRQWTWDDFFTAKENAYNMIDGQSHHVGVIMSGPREMAFPPNMLTHLRSALGNTHSNTKIVVVVIENAFLRAMINILIHAAKGSRSKLLIANTIEEARQAIREHLETPEV